MFFSEKPKVREVRAAGGAAADHGGVPPQMDVRGEEGQQGEGNPGPSDS